MSETVNPSESGSSEIVLRVHPSGKPRLKEVRWLAEQDKSIVSLQAFDIYGEPVLSNYVDIIKGEFWGWRYNVTQRLNGLPCEVLADREGISPGESFSRKIIPTENEELDANRVTVYEYDEKDNPRKKIVYKEIPDSIDREKIEETTYYFDAEGRIRASVKFGYYGGVGELSVAQLYQYEQVGDDLVRVIGVRYASRINLNDAFPTTVVLRQVNTRDNAVVARAIYDDRGVFRALLDGVSTVQLSKEKLNLAVIHNFPGWNILPDSIKLPTLITPEGILSFIAGAPLREIGK